MATSTRVGGQFVLCLAKMCSTSFRMLCLFYTWQLLGILPSSTILTRLRRSLGVADGELLLQVGDLYSHCLTAQFTVSHLPFTVSAVYAGLVPLHVDGA